MRKAILDTDILSEYLKGHNASVARNGAAYLQVHPAFTITSVTSMRSVMDFGSKTPRAN
jgi:hypothetical protein